MSSKTILIAEADLNSCETIKSNLIRNHYHCITCADVSKIQHYINKQAIDILLIDIGLQNTENTQLIDIINKFHSKLAIIVMANYADVHQAIAAVHQGAKDYLVKPFDNVELLDKISCYCKTNSTRLSVSQPVAEEQTSKDLLTLSKRVAVTDASVLITGESGVGKEVLAKFIHTQSTRSNKPFVAINCAAIPSNMLEATLFGYEKGAFTGAIQALPGKFEQAQGGTLLLDEISEMSLDLQAKLLRVLQEKEVERLGGRKIIKLDVRVIATSNQDLQCAVDKKQFRQDLYYRLNVFPLYLQPLRDRKNDIIPLSLRLIDKYAQQYKKPVPELTLSAQRVLSSYHWPGNVRELDNIIQRSLILHKNKQITQDDLYFNPTDFIKSNKLNSSKNKSQNHNKDHERIAELFSKYHGDRKLIAKELGISLRALACKLTKMRDAGIVIE